MPYVSRLGPSTASPSGGQRVAFGEPGGGLHTEHHLVVEFGDIRGADVRAGAAHASGDVCEQVLAPTAGWIQPHPRCRDALLEQRFADPVELAVGRGAGGNGAFGRHAVALLVRLVLTVAHQI